MSPIFCTPFLCLLCPRVFRRRNTDAAENAGIFPEEPLAGRGLLPQLHGPRRICARRFQEHAQIPRLDILRSGVCQHVQPVWRARLIAVFRRRAFKIRKRQIGFSAQPVAQKLRSRKASWAVGRAGDSLRQFRRPCPCQTAPVRTETARRCRFRLAAFCLQFGFELLWQTFRQIFWNV